jgi:predicted oxidoreductase
MASYTADVIVVGGGIAGITTALELLDHDRNVLMLDRDEEANFGGLAKESFGGLFFVNSREQQRNGIKDSPTLALRDWHSFAEFGPDDRLPKLWAETYVERCIPDVYEWLRAGGIRFLPLPAWVERGEARPGNSVPRFHIVWGTGRELATRLIAALRAHPNRARFAIKFGHRVERLITQAGRVAGCAGTHEEDGTPFEARAEHVVIASGGINGDIPRVKANWHRDWGKPPDVILNGSHKYADGTLHDAAAALGGRLTHLDNMWNYASGVHHYRPRKPHHGLSLVPAKSALWLNWRGERISPPLVSGFDTRALVTAICAQERQYSWQLLNRRIALKELAVSGAEFNPSIRDKSWLRFARDIILGNRWLVDELTANCGDFVVARSLPELVAKMNALQGDRSVDLAVLKDAVTRYDAEVARGAAARDAQLRRIAELRQYRGDRIRISKSQAILDERAMPLIAIREFIVSRKSLGGIVTDLQCRVQAGEDRAIPGLYAVGEATGFGGGGMHGLRGLEGTFLGGSILTGRMAGRSIGRDSLAPAGRGMG